MENVDYLPAGGAVTGMTGEQASTAIGDLGWRLVLGRLCTSVRAGSLAEAAKLAARIVAVAGAGADGHLVVCVGFTSAGDVIVNDPGTRQQIRHIVPRENLVRAWAPSHNTVYLIYPDGMAIPSDRFGHWNFSKGAPN